MRTMLIAAAMLALATPAMAQDAAETVRHGQILRDANNARIGKISRVEDDGSLRVIFNQRLATIPADTVSVVEGRPVTSLTKKEVARLK